MFAIFLIHWHTSSGIFHSTDFLYILHVFRVSFSIWFHFFGHLIVFRLYFVSSCACAVRRLDFLGLNWKRHQSFPCGAGPSMNASRARYLDKDCLYSGRLCNTSICAGEEVSNWRDSFLKLSKVELCLQDTSDLNFDFWSTIWIGIMSRHHFVRSWQSSSRWRNM